MRCPFEWIEIFDCIYKDSKYKTCQDLENCPANSDAWCTNMIENAISNKDSGYYQDYNNLDDVDKYVEICKNYLSNIRKNQIKANKRFCKSFKEYIIKDKKEKNMQKGQNNYAKRKALELFDSWNDVTGVITKFGCHYYEICSVIEDAVEIGSMIALGIDIEIKDGELLKEP